MEKELQLWLQVKELLKDSNEVAQFNDLIEPINKIHKVQNNYIYLIVPSILDQYRIERFYLNRFNELLASITTEMYKFKIICEDNAKKEIDEATNHKLNEVNPIEKQLYRRNLRPEYNFESFVTGESNRYAYMTALKVAESPHVTVNPLYIFGDVGLGKTHLMMAIGHYILDNNMNAKVVYTTAQQFAENYYLATRKKNDDSMEIFYSTYRSADMLLVDDVQLLAKKDGSQEEFFKVFEFLFENNKQIVITSDRPSNELDIMARLKSRFSWGIPVDIKKPDLEHRKLILRKKACFLINNPNDINDDILTFIAANFDQNVRELEGALRRFIDYCVAFNIPYTLQNAEIALESIISKDKLSQNCSSNREMNLVIEAVSEYFKISLDDIISNSRKQSFVYPRHIAIYLAKSLYNTSLKKIGESLGNRDHATIAHGYDKINDNLKDDWAIKNDINNITKIIEKKQK